MVTEEDLTLGGEHTTQHTDDAPQNYAPETYIILLTDVTQINLTFKKELLKGLRWQILRTCVSPQ